MKRKMSVDRIDYDISINAIKFQFSRICTNCRWRLKSFLKMGQFLWGLLEMYSQMYVKY